MKKGISRYFCAILMLLLVLSCVACAEPVLPTQTIPTRPTNTQPTVTNPTVTMPTAPTQPAYPDGATIHVDDAAYYAPYIGIGSYEIALEIGINYFLFVPHQAGEYRFSLPGMDAEIGYYGRADFVQHVSLAEMEDYTVTICVRDGMISKDDPNSSAFVIAVSSQLQRDSCVLMVERIGDPSWDVSDEPWIVYEPTVELMQYSLPEGASLMNFDLTAPTDDYELVFNENDGFYHLGSDEGPLVLVYLKKRTAYLDELFTVANLSNLCHYLYDGEGNFIKRETYNHFILECCQYADEKTGVYPLTKDLVYVIRQHGDFTGWWDMDDPFNCIFRDEDGNVIGEINPDIAWLFICCYLNQ